MDRFWTTCGAFLAGLAVACGALAAHGLEGHFATLYSGQTRDVAGETIPAATKYLRDFRTAAEYQMSHALALLAVAVMAAQKPSRLVQCAGWSFLFGIVLFSGSLYVLTLTGQRWLGMITPLGGVLFLIGWSLLAVAATRR